MISQRRNLADTGNCFPRKPKTNIALAVVVIKQLDTVLVPGDFRTHCSVIGCIESAEVLKVSFSCA